jgi:hypothetical protein
MLRLNIAGRSTTERFGGDIGADFVIDYLVMRFD